MISKKFSTNPESVIKFGRGRRIDLATSHGYTHIYIFIRNGAAFTTNKSITIDYLFSSSIHS
jgi:hypothetical protein